MSTGEIITIEEPVEDSDPIRLELRPQAAEWQEDCSLNDLDLPFEALEATAEALEIASRSVRMTKKGFVVTILDWGFEIRIHVSRPQARDPGSTLVTIGPRDAEPEPRVLSRLVLPLEALGPAAKALKRGAAVERTVIHFAGRDL